MSASKTFEQFCLDTWEFTRDFAYKQIAAAEVMQQIASVYNCIQMPANERQARPLQQYLWKKLKEFGILFLKKLQKIRKENPRLRQNLLKRL